MEVTATSVDAERERADRDDLISVDRLAGGVDREHPVSVPVERDAEVVAAAAHRVGEHREVGRPATGVDVRAVGRVGDRRHLVRRAARTRPGAIPEYAPFAQSTAIRSPLRSEPNRSTTCSTYPVDCILGMLDAAATELRGIEQRLDLELLGVGELTALVVEDLDAVVLGRVVRRGDHEPEVLREQRDRGRRQHAREHGSSACGHDPADESVLQRQPGGARVAPDQHPAAPRPEGRGLPEPLDEVLGERLADDTAHAVGPEVHPGFARLHEVLVAGRRVSHLVSSSTMPPRVATGPNAERIRI